MSSHVKNQELPPMRTPRILFFPEEKAEEPPSHYEAAGDTEELVKVPRDTLFTPMRIFYAILILLLTVVVPVVIFSVMVSNSDTTPDQWTCNIIPEYRVPCPKTIATDCERSGCCWNGDDKVCFHSVPSQHSYKVEDWQNETALKDLETKYLKLKPRLSSSLYGKERDLQTRVVSTSDFILRLYIYDPGSGGPDIKNTTKLNSSQFNVSLNGPEFYSLEIHRKEQGGPLLFKTSLGPTIACDDYWELTLKFSNDSAVFGLGSLRLPSTPKLLYNNGNRLGANPFIMILDTEGKAHGILFNSAGPMEFQLLEKSNLLIVKSLSRVMWDISVFAGPNPSDVMEQYTSVDGLRPTLPPAWALGAHICRDTERYNRTLAAEDAIYFLQNAMDRELPYESDCLQEGLLYQMDFNISTSMDVVKQNFSSTGRKLLLSLPPHVEYSLAKPEKLFVSDGNVILQEEFQDLNISYPDFFNEELQEWFSSKIRNVKENVADILGGFVLQDNWPASDTKHNTIEDMKVPEGALSEGTLWWLARHVNNESHYRLHNEYGLRHAKFVASNLAADTTLVLSAATHTGVGTVGGSHAHEQADVKGTWSNMKTALRTALGLGLTGIPLAGGGDVCGTTGGYDEELCVRWYLMSSMLPLMRVSSEVPLRDPVNLPSENSRQVVKAALELRYSLLAYFYSLFHEANRTGVPVARPMFFDFPNDKSTWTIDEQFMIGPALMASPAFYKDALNVLVYLPRENTTWYHFNGGHKINNGTGNLTVSVTSLEKQLVLLLRGGFIVPSQEAKLTVDETLAGPYSLVVGLQCGKDGACYAKGSLYRQTEGSQINLTFTANETGLAFNGSCSNVILQDVSVYGLKVSLDNCPTCNVVSSTTKANCTVKEVKGAIKIDDLQLELCGPDGGTIEWRINTKECKTKL